MSARELVVLGTASQVPTRHRNHNGYFLRWDRLGFLFDPGEGTQRQMIHFGVTAHSVTHVLISHFHGDHCLGFASIVQRISLDRVPHPVQVHYPGSGELYYERLRHASIFVDHSHLQPRPIERDGADAPVDDVTLSWRRLDHGVDCYGYRISEADRFRFDKERLHAAGLDGPIVGRLHRGETIEHEGRLVRREDFGELHRGNHVAFVMDTRQCDAAIELARDVDLLVIESTYQDDALLDARDHFHLTARQAATIGKQAGARRVVLTHFSQRYPRTDGFLAEAREVHDDVVCAEDGLTVTVPRPV